MFKKSINVKKQSDNEYAFCIANSQKGKGRIFRLVCLEEEKPVVFELLQAEGYEFEPESFSPLVYRLCNEPSPLGSSLAACFGYIYIQDKSSMLPPLVLNPPLGATVFDLCASPGSKAGLLAQLVGKNGFVLGNEPNPTRLATLRHNLEILNLIQTATSHYPGESVNLPDQTFSYIVLDPPCSGWGTVERNPKVLELWAGDKIKPLIALQRHLLAKSSCLLKKGGLLVYSTCTTNVAENEEQINWAREQLGLKLVNPEILPGFDFEDPALPDCSGVLRLSTKKGQEQGFFVALLQKEEEAELPDLYSAMQENNNITDNIKQSLAVQSKKQIKEEAKNKIIPGKFGIKNESWQNNLLSSIINKEILSNPYLDMNLLPKGELAIFGQQVYFLAAQALHLAELSFNNRQNSFGAEIFKWRGFPIAKVNANIFKPVSSLHCLMPKLKQMPANLALNIEEIKPLKDLLAGRSFNVNMDVKQSELALYFNGLALGIVKVKAGNRIIW